MRLERAWLVLLLAGLVAAPAGAEIYKHVDPEGRILFTNRPEALPDPRPEKWDASSGALQRFERAPAPRQETDRQQLAVRGSAQTDGEGPAAHVDADGTTHVAFQRSGNLMLVHVQLNDDLTAPFYVDSGCTGISITRDVASRLGLDRRSIRRLTETRTANGTILLAKVRLDSVALGSSRVTDLAASINPHLSVGLLGASFLNHFVYSVDPLSGVISLRPRSS